MKTSAGNIIYKQIMKRRKLILLAMVAATIALFLLDVALGPMNYSLTEVFKTIFNPDSSPAVMRSVIWNSRLPEAITALLVGTALGMAGAEMQTILDNPLAEPYTLGISTSAAFGASLVISFGVGTGVLGDYALPICAFTFASITCFAIYSVAKVKSSDRNTIILMGVAHCCSYFSH